MLFFLFKWHGEINLWNLFVFHIGTVKYPCWFGSRLVGVDGKMYTFSNARRYVNAFTRFKSKIKIKNPIELKAFTG